MPGSKAKSQKSGSSRRKRVEEVVPVRAGDNNGEDIVEEEVILTEGDESENDKIAMEGEDESDDDYDDVADDDDEDDDDDDDEEEFDSEDDSEGDPEDSDDFYGDDEPENQGSSSDEDEEADDDSDDSDDEDLAEVKLPDLNELAPPRKWAGGVVKAGSVRETVIRRETEKNIDAATRGHHHSLLHVDDLSSDDEEGGNTIGRVPLHWYDEYDHVGYNVSGSKVMKPASSGASALDAALDYADDPEKKYEIEDALNAKTVKLTPRDIEIIRRIQSGAYAHPEHDANPDYIDYYTSIPMKEGLNSNRPLPKRGFQSSKWEALHVRRLLRRLKNGDIDMDYLTGKKKSMQPEEKMTDDPFQMWKGDEEDEILARKGPAHIAAPKVAPPGHAESYNPPAEYIPTEEELKAWDDLDVEDRPYGLLIPKKHTSLRSVGAYEHAVRERFERCLDLYLCPRAMKKRLNIDPESLVPTLPKAEDLRPFPTARCVKYVLPEASRVRAISVSPDGQYMCSGSDDGTLRIWEVTTAKLLRSWKLNDIPGLGEDPEGTIYPITTVEWNPKASVVMVSIGWCAVLVVTGTGGAEVCELTEALLANVGGGKLGEKVAKVVKWNKAEPDGQRAISKHATLSGIVGYLKMTARTTCVKWHRRGDYFVTVSPKAGAPSVLIHQLSKGSSQQPFNKAKQEVTAACFHPSKPFLFAGSRESIKIYHLVKQVMVKKLIGGSKHIVTMDVHPSGDHIIAGGLDKRVSWWDLDLSSSPYKTLRYHEKAVRDVAYSRKWPIMASASDDGNVNIFHSMVYDDLIKNPLIVPVKVLRNAHPVTGRLGALGMVWHPRLPWLFTSGADGNVVLWQDV